MTHAPARRLSAWLLMLALTFAGLLPHRTALAGEPFQFVSVTAFDEARAFPITEGNVISRNVDVFVLKFNHDLDFPTINDSVSWTDSTGAPAHIGQEISFGTESNQTVRTPLKSNEAYTLTIKGGADGVRDIDGNTLPQDIIIQFTTDAGPLMTTVRPALGWDQYRIRQTDNFIFEAAAGKLKIAMGLADGAEHIVAVSGPSPDQLVWSGVLTPEATEVEIDLPQSGTYSLVVGPMTEHLPSPGRFIEVTGPDLKMPGLRTPPLQVTEMAKFESHNTPFDVDVRIESREYPPQPVPAKQVEVLVDEKPYQENILGADGITGKVTIDPTNLKDGVHRILVIARSADSETESAVQRTIFVDRVGTFPDVPESHWARKHIEFMADLAIINGTESGLFAPGQPVTRAAFAKMLALTIRLPKTPGDVPFADVDYGHWAWPYLHKLAVAGLMKGEVIDGETYMRPERTITRAEAATIIGRALGVADLDLSEADLDPSAYDLPDLDAIPAWAKSSVLVLKSEGWITGYPDGRFAPADTLNRDQAAKLISQFLGL